MCNCLIFISLGSDSIDKILVYLTVGFGGSGIVLLIVNCTLTSLIRPLETVQAATTIQIINYYLDSICQHTLKRFR